MRKIGQIASEVDANRFRNYLHSREIQIQIDASADNFEIWVLEEDQLDIARQELAEFLANSSAEKYTVAQKHKVSSPLDKRTAHKPGRSRSIEVNSLRPRITLILISMSVFVSLSTDFCKTQPDLIGSLLITNQNGRSLPEVMQGEVWRLFTPMFLHFNVLHLLFNSYITWLMGGTIERMRGSRYLLLLVCLIAPISHLTQFAISNAAFGGLSGVVYGLFGFLWMRSRFLPEEDFFMPNAIVVQMLLWLFLCLTGALGPVANGAHFGGLIAGMLIGVYPLLPRR